MLWGIRDRHCWNVFYRDSRSFMDRRRGRNRARSSGNSDGDQREFDLETRVTTNGNRIISEMFHSCALNK